MIEINARITVRVSLKRTCDFPGFWREAAQYTLPRWSAKFPGLRCAVRGRPGPGHSLRPSRSRPPRNAVFGKAIHCLSKFGQDLFFECLPDRVGRALLFSPTRPPRGTYPTYSRFATVHTEADAAHGQLEPLGVCLLCLPAALFLQVFHGPRRRAGKRAVRGAHPLQDAQPVLPGGLQVPGHPRAHRRALRHPRRPRRLPPHHSHALQAR